MFNINFYRSHLWPDHFLHHIGSFTAGSVLVLLLHPILCRLPFIHRQPLHGCAGEVVEPILSRHDDIGVGWDEDTQGRLTIDRFQTLWGEKTVDVFNNEDW